MDDLDRSVPTRPRPRRAAWTVAALSCLVVGLLAAVGGATSPTASALDLAPTPAGATGPGRGPLQWVWPAPTPIRVVAPFRAPPTPYSAGHRGIDLAVAPGATVVAAAGGTVRFAGMVAGRGVVSIDHGDGVISSIEPITALVREGDVLAAGDRIGAVDRGGHCEGDCVHFGIRVDGEYVSPFLFFGGLPRSVLLPLS